MKIGLKSCFCHSNWYGRWIHLISEYNMGLGTFFGPLYTVFLWKRWIFLVLFDNIKILKSGIVGMLHGSGCLEIIHIVKIDGFMCHRTIFYWLNACIPFPKVKNGNVVEITECFWSCLITHYFIIYVFIPSLFWCNYFADVAMAQNIVFYFNWIKMLCKL